MKKIYIARTWMFIGVAAVLSIITLSTSAIVAGEMAYQKLWLGRTIVVFVGCSLVSWWMDKGNYTLYPAVVWSLILLGGIEAIWGMRQLYGLALSNHTLYTLTGSFYNPGPYSGYLGMVFPVCLNEWLLLKEKTKHTWMDKVLFYTSLIVLLLILCILPAGMSRSAWVATGISGLWIYSMHCSWYTRLSETYRKRKKWTLTGVLIGGIVFMIAGYALFQLKADSASGRLLIWKVSSLAIVDSPLTGYGFGSFASAYSAAQESYFAKGEYSATEEWVAGSPEYAFNEYLQVAVEWGIPALVMALLFVGFCLWKGINEKRWAACGGVISVLVFAIASYPMQIPGFSITFCFLLAACVVERSKMRMVLFTLLIALLGGWYWKTNQYEACTKWNQCKILYYMKTYRSAMEDYETLYPALKNRGTFLYEYGHCLHNLEEYERSTELLEEALKHSSDPMILNIIGENYQLTGNYEQAEAYYLRSTHRLPGRIYPYYLLAKLYAEPAYRRPEKLKQAIEVVLTKEPKVQSTAVREMRNKVKKLLDKN